MKQKHWKVSVFDKTFESIKNDTFYTTDTEAYLVFELTDEDFTPESAMVTVYNVYGKATINASVEVADGIIRYEMPEEAIGHPGGWRTQVIFTKDNEDYTTKIIEFDVGGHLLDNKKPAIVDIENWNSFIAHAGELIDDWEQLEEIRQANEQARESAESVRVSNEEERELNEEERISKDSERDSKIEAVEGLQSDLISGAVDSAAVQKHVEERYGQLEEEYAPKLTEVTAQLAQKATKGQITNADFDISSEGNKMKLINLSDEVHQALTGNAPALSIIEDEAVTREKIARRAVGEEKLSFVPLHGKKGKNLFDKKTITPNTIINTSTGHLSNLSNFYTSDYIEVLSNTDYTLTSGRGVAFYDINKVFISFTRLDSGTITSPSNAVFVRLDNAIDRLDRMQFEKGTESTYYEPHKNWLDTETIKDGSIEEKSFQDFSVSKLKEYEVGKNLFDNQSNDIIRGSFISELGVILPAGGRNVSEYIKVEPGESYALRFPQHSAFFDADKVYISGFSNSAPPNFVAPSNAKYFRTTVDDDQMYTQQLEKGESFTKYEPFEYRLKKMASSGGDGDRVRICTFKDAWISWENGGKFPVGFLGDSTTDGNSTTGFSGHLNADNAAGGIGMADYHAPNAYPKVLQDLIHEETGNTNARIYNMGYSGTQHLWARPRLDDIIGHVYSDVQMVGFAYGINDRGGNNTASFEEKFRQDTEEFIDYFYSRGIQPFMVTTQATVEPSTLQENQDENKHLLRTSEAVNSVANRVKKELAQKHNLEIIDMNSFGEFFMTYSSVPITKIIPDTLHMTDAGHKAEAEYIFNHFCPRVIDVEDDTILSFTSQKMKSKVPSDKTTLMPVVSNGFKVKADYTKNDSNDMLILDFWILNRSKGLFQLKSFATTTGTTYVKVDGVTTTLTSAEQLLTSDLDIGLHHIQVFTGESDKVDFIGFKMEKVSQ